MHLVIMSKNTTQVFHSFTTAAVLLAGTKLELSNFMYFGIKT